MNNLEAKAKAAKTTELVGKARKAIAPGSFLTVLEQLIASAVANAPALITEIEALIAAFGTNPPTPAPTPEA